MHEAHLESLPAYEGRTGSHLSLSSRVLQWKPKITALFLTCPILPGPLLRHLRFLYNCFGHASPKSMTLGHFLPYLERLSSLEPASTNSQVPAEPSAFLAPQRSVVTATPAPTGPDSGLRVAT